MITLPSALRAWTSSPILNAPFDPDTDPFFVGVISSNFGITSNIFWPSKNTYVCTKSTKPSDINWIFRDLIKSSLDVETKLFWISVSVLVLVIVCLRTWPKVKVCFPKPFIILVTLPVRCKLLPKFILLLSVVPVCCTVRSSSCTVLVHVSSSGSNSTSL